MIFEDISKGASLLILKQKVEFFPTFINSEKFQGIFTIQ